jgi:putative Ca2+/H+ antiporter (TMEM165/GDT1 family)
MDWDTLFATFGVLFLAELGDKTQLAVIAQVCRFRRPVAVFAGASLGLILVTALGVVAGQAIGQIAPTLWVQRIAAAGFVIMGGFIAWQAWRTRHPAEIQVCEEEGALNPGRVRWQAFGTTLGLLALAELGDKTQLATFVQASRSGAPWEVFVGAALALTGVTVLGVVGGQALARFVPEQRLRWLAAAAFVAMGILIGVGIL